MSRDADAKPPCFEEITLRNFLSFRNLEAFPLRRLNVLIGPNGAGKSNLIEAFGLMRETPNDVRPVITRGGGAQEWIWKGASGDPAEVELVIGRSSGQPTLRHHFAFAAANQSFEFRDERIENAAPFPGHREPYFYYRFQGGSPAVNEIGSGRRSLVGTAHFGHSVLSQLRDAERYPEITELSQTYGEVRIYREWAFGRNTIFRLPQKADLPEHPLDENFLNLGMVLNHFDGLPAARRELSEALEQLYAEYSRLYVKIVGASVQVYFEEHGSYLIPATRLSDGSLRFLCLAAILCDPNPPALLCIEEPELGLHTDLLLVISRLLADASRRTQLIVTTHSDRLLDCIDDAESVVVCEKENGETVLRRLNQEELAPELETHSLGRLWTKGYFGGVRW